MNPPDLVPILRAKSIDRLYHANTVQTACTFLGTGLLASRGYVDVNGLKQSRQNSDATDQRYGIWFFLFLDTDDLHARTRSHNYYGPVLFGYDVDFLNHLPANSQAWFTKTNPYPNWRDGQARTERWIDTPDEVQRDVVKGRTDHILVLDVPTKALSFTNGWPSIVLDDPEKPLTTGEDAYTHAHQHLTQAAASIDLRPTIVKRQCNGGCRCLNHYASTNLDQAFRADP